MAVRVLVVEGLFRSRFCMQSWDRCPTSGGFCTSYRCSFSLHLFINTEMQLEVWVLGACLAAGLAWSHGPGLLLLVVFAPLFYYLTMFVLWVLRMRPVWNVLEQNLPGPKKHWLFGNMHEVRVNSLIMGICSGTHMIWRYCDPLDPRTIHSITLASSLENENEITEIGAGTLCKTHECSMMKYSVVGVRILVL